jgi:hypothetical protein
MFIPFYRGEDSWSARVQAVAYSKNAEYLSQVYRNNPPLDSGLNLPISELVYKYIASKQALADRFGECYDWPRNLIRCSIARTCLEASRCTDDVMEHLGADFDFSMSLYFDQAFFKNRSYDEMVGPRIYNRASLLAQNRIREGFVSYQREDYNRAFYHFSKAYDFDTNLYTIQYRIGLLFLNHAEFVREESAFAAFRSAGEKAARDAQREFAAHCYVHAAFCAYLLSRDQESLELSQQAIALSPALKEAIYLNAKILSLSDSDLSLTRLHTIVHMNRNYALRIGADKDLDSVSETFFKSLNENGEQEAEPAREEFRSDVQNIKRIEQNLARHGQIVAQLGLDRRFFHQFHEESEQLDTIYGRHTFFDYMLFMERYRAFQQKYRTNQFLRQLQFGPSYIAQNRPDLNEIDENISDVQQRAKVVKLMLTLILSIFAFLTFSLLKIQYTPLSALFLIIAIIIIITLAWPEEFARIILPIKKNFQATFSPAPKQILQDVSKSKTEKDWMKWIFWLNFILLTATLFAMLLQIGLGPSIPLFLIIIILFSVLSLLLLLRFLKRREENYKSAKKEMEEKIKEYFTPPK